MVLYCSKQLETTIHQFCEKPLHITFKTVVCCFLECFDNVGWVTERTSGPQTEGNQLTQQVHPENSHQSTAGWWSVVHSVSCNAITAATANNTTSITCGQENWNT